MRNKDFNYDSYFNKLNEIANKLGYAASYRKNIRCSRVSHHLKAIEIKKESEVDTIYAFSHELGHCYIHDKVKHKMLNEISAWIIGLCLCIKEGIPIKLRFFPLVYESLKTHWKYRT